MLQGYTMAIVPCVNPKPKKLPTGGGEWPTFRTARAQRTVRPLCPGALCSCASYTRPGTENTRQPPLGGRSMAPGAACW